MKVEVDVPNKPTGFCGRKATLQHGKALLRVSGRQSVEATSMVRKEC